jgi:hypothetical protein
MTLTPLVAGSARSPIPAVGYWLLRRSGNPGPRRHRRDFSQVGKVTTAVRRNSPPRKPATRDTIPKPESEVSAEQPPFFGHWADANQGEYATFCRHRRCPCPNGLRVLDCLRCVPHAGDLLEHEFGKTPPSAICLNTGPAVD